MAGNWMLTVLERQMFIDKMAHFKSVKVELKEITLCLAKDQQSDIIVEYDALIRLSRKIGSRSERPNEYAETTLSRVPNFISKYSLGRVL